MTSLCILKVRDSIRPIQQIKWGTPGMAKRFSVAVEEAPDGERSVWRALQCWQILVSKASTNSIMTYGELADMMGYADARPLSRILGHILFYCQQNELPPLNSLVVNQETGLPGEGIGIEAEQIPSTHMAVFREDWFDIVPPTIKELGRAFERGMGR